MFKNLSTKAKRLIKITQVLLLVVTSILIGYDVYVAITGIFSATISKQTQYFSVQFPAIPVLWGLLEGHFFYGKIGRKLFGGIPVLRYFIWIPIVTVIVILCVINLFTPIAFIVFLGEWLFVPSMFGQLIGLFWWQNKINQ
jgi:hypothetical protein